MARIQNPTEFATAVSTLPGHEVLGRAVYRDGKCVLSFSWQDTDRILVSQRTERMSSFTAVFNKLKKEAKSQASPNA
jgi:hypothetical protein